MKSQNWAPLDVLRIVGVTLSLAGTSLLVGYLSTQPKYLILVIGGVIGAVLLFKRKYLLIALVCLIFSILPFSLNVGGITEVQIYYAIIPLFLWILLNGGTNQDFRASFLANPFLILFLLIVVLNYFRNPGLPSLITGSSSDGQIQFGYLMKSLALLCGYLIIPFLIKTRQQLKLIVIVLTGFFILGLIFAWLGFLYDIESPFVPGYGGELFLLESVFGTTTRFGWVGNYAFYLLPFVLVGIPNKSKLILIKIMVLVGLLISIFVSGGRAQLLAFGISLIVYIALTMRSILWLIILSLISVGFYFLIFQSDLVRNIPQLGRFSVQGITYEANMIENGITVSRLGVISLSLEMIREQPWIGEGPATNKEIENLRRVYWNAAFYTAREGSHSTYFNIPAIYGIPAFLIYMIGIGLVLLRLFAAYRYEKKPGVYNFLLVVMVGTLVMFLFSGSALGGFLYFYMMLGLGDSVTRKKTLIL